MTDGAKDEFLHFLKSCWMLTQQACL